MKVSKESVRESKLPSQVTRALDVAVPLIAVNTSDPGATQATLTLAINSEVPKVAFDVVRGLHSLNPKGDQLLTTLSPEDIDQTKNNPVKALVLAENFPEETVLFFHNAQMFIKQPAVTQAVWNLRDRNKTDGRCLIMMMPIGSDLPVEIRSDVMVFDDPLPTDSQLLEIVEDQIRGVEDTEEVDLKECHESAPTAASSLKGTNAFQAEQLVAMAMHSKGFEHDYLATGARKMIEQTKGLMFERGEETFDDVKGMQGVEQWAEDIFGGPAAPAVIVRIEELEKSMAGVHGDLSGTSQDTHQVLLSAMEDEGWDGAICYGVPGAGKSLMAKSLANTHGARGLRFDINECKGSLVGQSEAQIRQAVEVIKTLGGNRVLFLASCNRMDTLPPELLRRFRSGVWFFDTPSKEAREEMWNLHMNKYGYDPFTDDEFEQVDEEDFTGADIRNICEQAWKRGRTIKEAKKWVIPLKARSADTIKGARDLADKKFWDVATGEVYIRDKKPATSKRRAKLAKHTA